MNFPLKQMFNIFFLIKKKKKDSWQVKVTAVHYMCITDVLTSYDLDHAILRAEAGFGPLLSDSRAHARLGYLHVPMEHSLSFPSPV